MVVPIALEAQDLSVLSCGWVMVTGGILTESNHHQVFPVPNEVMSSKVWCYVMLCPSVVFPVSYVHYFWLCMFRWSSCCGSLGSTNAWISFKLTDDAPWKSLQGWVSDLKNSPPWLSPQQSWFGRETKWNKASQLLRFTTLDANDNEAPTIINSNTQENQ